MKVFKLLLLLTVCFNLVSCNKSIEESQSTIDVSNLVTAPVEETTSVTTLDLEDISFDIQEVGFEQETPTELELEGNQIINLEENNINLGNEVGIGISSSTNSTDQEHMSVELSTEDIKDVNVLPSESLPKTGQISDNIWLLVLVGVLVLFSFFIAKYKEILKRADNSK